MLLIFLVLISEIMFDPDPSVGLPAYEYVELYNPGNESVDLTGWMWVVGSKSQTVKMIKKGVVPPGGFLILCSQSATNHFRLFGEVGEIESFPALRNTGDRLSLLNRNRELVHTVSYAPDRFDDLIKENGGWSLELADYSKPCSDEAWRPSCDPSGGTPGRANSQNLALPDVDPPLLLRAGCYDSGELFLLFSGGLAPLQAHEEICCRFSPGELIASMIPSPMYGFPGLFFELPEGVEVGLTYSIELQGEVFDCSGQKALTSSISFALPQPPVAGDLVISEVMFDPIPGQVEFVELFNLSDHTVELGDLLLACADTAGKVVSFSDDQECSYLLLPGEYALFTGNGRLFHQAWPDPGLACAAIRSDMPTLVNSEARLLLLTSTGDTIDQISYSPDWHYPYLAEKKGISLERADFQRSGLNQTNWFSASAGSGGATPGRINSNRPVARQNEGTPFTIVHQAEWNQNHQDQAVVVIAYAFDDPGWFAQVSVFNDVGKAVRVIFPFNQLGKTGSLIWDGLDQQGRLVEEGIYLLIAEYVHPSGQKGRWKSACGVRRD